MKFYAQEYKNVYENKENKMLYVHINFPDKNTTT